MTLSVLLGIHQPAPVAAAILAPLREVADEIVLAVDQRVDPGVLGAYEALADRLLRVEYCGSVALAWKHRQCSGDWVLRLDADEVPSAALVAALPGAVRRRGDAPVLAPDPLGLAGQGALARRASVVARLPQPARSQ